MGTPQKLKVELPYNPAGPCLDIYSPKMKTINSERHGHRHAHCSIIYKSQDMEVETMPTEMNGYIRRSIYTNNIFSQEKSPAIWDNMDGPRRHCAK